MTDTNTQEVVQPERTEQGFADAYKAAQTRINVVESRVPMETTPPVVQPQPEVVEGQGGEGGENGEVKEVSPKPGHPTFNLEWLNEVPETHQDKVRQLLNEHKAAIGRAAYLQSQTARRSASERKPEAQFKPFVPPAKPEDWNALNEADPKLAETFDSRLKAELEARDKHWQEQIAEQLNPILQAEAQRQAQYTSWREAQVQQLYEAHPHWSDVLRSDDYQRWIQGIDEQAPGFAEYARTVEHAYGDTSRLNGFGAVDIMNLFFYHKSQAENGNAAPNPAGEGQQQPPQPAGNADRVVQNRNERLNQPPIPNGNPAQAVTQRMGQLDATAAFNEAYRRAQERLGIRKPS